MKSSRISMGKIVNHGAGVGAPCPETVRERAMELAEIDGRREITEGDWEQAKLELHGGVAGHGNDDDEMTSSVSERDMIVIDRGHHLPNFRDDTENAVEELVAEGMEEAEHDRMLEASRRTSNDDSEA